MVISLSFSIPLIKTEQHFMAVAESSITTIRQATLDDLDTLVDIENRCFETDRLNRRNFRYLLTKAKAAFLVDELNHRITGYGVLLFQPGTALARLYSFAVLPEYQGAGIGKRLLEAMETEAINHGRIAVRLEIRQDNVQAMSLYRKFGYRELEALENYYEDHEDGVRMEKNLAPRLNTSLARVPYYEQTLEFTCGPAAIMMAMKCVQPDMQLDRMLELRLWREATTIFMTSGHGGCTPFGLALSAYRMGFDVDIVLKDKSALFVDTVRSKEKKEVVALVHEDFREQIRKAGIRVRYGTYSINNLESTFQQGGVPVVLISSYRIYQEKSPHWVVVTGYDSKFVYLHDPYVDYEENKSRTDCMNLPILKEEFFGMARYGKTGQRAVVIIRRRNDAQASST